MTLVILPIPDAMIRETRLPDVSALSVPVRESSFDELHDALDGDFFSGRE